MKKSSAILIVSAMIFALLLPVSIFAYGDAYISANDPNIKYVGRWVWEEDGSVTGYFESSLEFSFTGTSIAVDFGECNGTVLFTVDGGPAKLKSYYSAKALEFASGLENATHFIEIHCNFQGSCPVIKGFYLDNGCITVKSPERKSIEIIGDSISVGYVGTGFAANVNSVGTTFGYKVAKKLNLSSSTVAHGGIALSAGKNSNPDKIGMINRYFYTGEYNTGRESTPWETSKYIPDYIILNIGFNDRCETADEFTRFINEYTLFLQKLREAYPQTPIFCLTEFVPQYAKPIKEAVDKRVDVGDELLIYIDSSDWVADGQKNPEDGVHLLQEGHDAVAEKLYNVMKAYIDNGMKPADNKSNVTQTAATASDKNGEASSSAATSKKSGGVPLSRGMLYLVATVAAGTAFISVITVINKKKKRKEDEKQ